MYHSLAATGVENGRQEDGLRIPFAIINFPMHTQRKIPFPSLFYFADNFSVFHTSGNGRETDKQEVRFTLDFIGSNALSKMVEIRGVGPLTFSMPLRRSTN